MLSAGGFSIGHEAAWRRLVCPPKRRETGVDFSISIDIAAPPSMVWSVMSDIERWPEWTASVRRVTRFGKGPLRVASRALIRQPGFPPALWRVTAVEPGRSFTWKSGLPGLRVLAHHEVIAAAGGARATLALHFAGLLGPMFGRLTSRINNEYLHMEAAGLKRRSEARSR
jgi:uncharacterized protein YndB with AHSA1/START domain